MPVEWARSCYASTWRLFRDNATFEVHGEYYKADPKLDFVPGPTLYTSRDWYSTNWEILQGLGETLDAKHSWRSGNPPAVIPDPILLGSLDCLAKGEDWANRIGSTSMIDGLPEKCFLAPVVANIPWGMVSAFNSCSMHLFYLTIIEWATNNDIGSITTAFQLLLGPAISVVLTIGNANFPNVVTVVAPTFSVIVLNGTNTTQQAALQAFQGVLPPSNQGIVGTLPLWYAASSRADAILTSVAADPAKPIMIVGHSYGGSIAALLAARYRFADSSRKIVRLTFGSPKPGNHQVKTLNDLVPGMDVANDNDLVTVLPPDLALIIPVQAVLGVAGLFVWDQWKRPSKQYTMDNAGSLTANTWPLMGFATMLMFTQRVLANQPLPVILGHFVTEYIRRTLLRCPFPEWPISNTLFVYLTTNTLPAENGIVIGGPAATLEGNLVIGGPAAILEGNLVIGGPDIAIGNLVIGGPAAILEGNLVIGGPAAILEGNLVIGGAAPIVEGNLVIGGPAAILEGNLEIGA